MCACVCVCVCILYYNEAPAQRIKFHAFIKPIACLDKYIHTCMDLLWICLDVQSGRSRFILIGEVSLDQVRANSAFKFNTLYEFSEIDVEDNIYSPFSQLVNNCDYCDLQQFRNNVFRTSKSLSYFQLNCRS